MPPDFHARPTAPVPQAHDSLRMVPIARPRMQAHEPVLLDKRRTRPPEAPLSARPPPPVQEAPRPVPLAPALPVRPPFPRLRFSAIDVSPAAHTARGTKLWTVVGVVGAVCAVLAAAAGTMGLALFGLVLAPVLNYFHERKARALLNGTSLRVSDLQLPELHACVLEFSGRLGLKHPPAVYIVESNVVNGFAAKIGKKDIVLLTDDLVWGALAAKNPRALGFVVAHELAHVALGHTGTFRSIMRTVVKPLGRLDELSADNVARALVDDDTVAFEGLKILAVGPQLSAYVDDDALIAQANEVVANKQTKKLERKMSHPMIMRRLVNLLE